MSAAAQASTRSHGPGVGTLLGVLFVALKLCGVIGWSWLWVLAPFWIGAAFALFILASILVVAAVVSARR